MEATPATKLYGALRCFPGPTKVHCSIDEAMGILPTAPLECRSVNGDGLEV
ncbi:hypothetical protein EDC27_2412 [Desulfosoma caldarium]|uniref:Uncharacterized protein n=1 Tax=Desulfosoma caldarium TaxID=610254 RepID=A0A3N1UIQ0_9BACT|nr:hypothetical protein EDC27_2412 [Desulfosoma caldarium]